MIPHCMKAVSGGGSRPLCLQCEEDWGLPLEGAFTCTKCEDNAKQCIGQIPHCTTVVTGPNVKLCTACEIGYGVRAGGDHVCTSILNIAIKI